MAESNDVAALEARLDKIRQQLAAIGEVGSGSLSSRRLRCGNPNCRCKRAGEPGHGPYWYLTRKVAGRTVSRSVPAAEVEAVRQRIAVRQRLQALTAQLVEVSDQLCHARRACGDAAGSAADQRETLRAQFAADVEAEVDALCGRGAADQQDFEALEMAARREAMALAARALERCLNADCGDRSARSLPCSCGRPARYAGCPAKSFVSAVGTLRLERAYYHCQACGKGFHPRDRALGLEGGSRSPAVLRMTGSVAALASFAAASELLAELAGVRVEARQVERCAEALGREIAALEEAGGCAALPPTAPTQYLGLDGAGVPVRPSETQGRQGKQADGSARTREVKLVMVWTAETRNKQGRPERVEGWVSYSAGIESVAARDTDAEPSEFARRVRREAERRGFPQVSRRVIIGDGAKWIWGLAAEMFPGAIQIVHLFHAKERLWDVGKALFGDDKGRVEGWAEARCEELESGRLEAVRAALESVAPVCEQARQCGGYIAHNRERMRYPEFRRQGLCVGSGVVEAGCKTAIGMRLKRSGMRWTVAGANAVISLRCCKLSGRYEDFWETHAAPTV